MKKNIIRTVALGTILSMVMNTAVFAGYNASAAKEYAEKNYNNTSSGKYYYYKGKNCTNFVSQCVNAGGISQVENSDYIDSIFASLYTTLTDDDETYRYWYMSKEKKLGKTVYFTTPNWVRVEEFRRYQSLHKGTTYKYNVNNKDDMEMLFQSLKVGDVVQVGDEHSVIITSVGKNRNEYDILYTGQSTNRKNRAIHYLINFAKENNCNDIYRIKFK